MKKAVILFNLGGPDNLDNVEIDFMHFQYPGHIIFSNTLKNELVYD